MKQGILMIVATVVIAMISGCSQSLTAEQVGKKGCESFKAGDAEAYTALFEASFIEKNRDKLDQLKSMFKNENFMKSVSTLECATVLSSKKIDESTMKFKFKIPNGSIAMKTKNIDGTWYLTR